jgi:hypothetical protein
MLQCGPPNEHFPKIFLKIVPCGSHTRRIHVSYHNMLQQSPTTSLVGLDTLPIPHIAGPILTPPVLAFQQPPYSFLPTSIIAAHCPPLLHPSPLPSPAQTRLKTAASIFASAPAPPRWRPPRPPPLVPPPPSGGPPAAPPPRCGPHSLRASTPCARTAACPQMSRSLSALAGPTSTARGAGPGSPRGELGEGGVVGGLLPAWSAGAPPCAAPRSAAGGAPATGPRSSSPRRPPGWLAGGAAP